MRFAVAAYVAAGLASAAARPDTVWTRVWGGGGADVAYAACPNGVGGWLVTGLTGSRGAGGLDLFVLELGGAGEVLREVTYGGPSDDAGHDVIRLAAGGYAVAGYTQSFGAGRKDIYLLRLDEHCDTVWTRTYGGGLEDCSYAVREMADGGFAVVGYRDGPSGWTKGDLWVVRTGAGGETLWTRRYGGSGQDFASDLERLTDGGLAIAGQTGSLGAGNQDGWLLRLGPGGDTLWTRCWGGTQDDVFYAVEPASDGGWLLAGYTGGTPPWTPGDLWLVRSDSAGDTAWTRCWGGATPDVASALLAAGDGWLAAGSTGAGGREDAWLVRVGQDGDSLWSLCAGGGATDAAIALAPAPDGGWLAAGYTTSWGPGTPNVYAVRFAPDTAGAIFEQPAAGASGWARATVRAVGRQALERGRLVDACGRAVEPRRALAGVFFRVIESDDRDAPFRVERVVLVR